MLDKKFISAIALAAVLGAGGSLSLAPAPALAQAANAPPPQAAPAQPQQRPPRPSHVEGRIAYDKAELKITPAQEATWNKVADAMRQNDAERRQALEQMRGGRGQPTNALQTLERVSHLSAMRTQQTDRFLAAFRPLYEQLSPEQKKTADDLWGFHRHGFRGRR